MIAFRVDASPKVGSGHLVRSRRLAQVLKQRGHGTVIVAPEAYRRAEDSALFADWVPAGEWTTPEADAGRFAAVAERHGCRVAYVDDYRADESFQDVLTAAGLRWMQQFDASLDRSYRCDALVNASPSKTLLRFGEELRKPGARGMFGPTYAILRPEFPPAVRPAARPLAQALVSFGGGDDRGATLAVLGALLPASPAETCFVVVSGEGNPRNKEIARWIEANARERATLLVNPPNVAETFASCDIALIAGGTMTSECAACGLPMLLYAMAENQINQCQGWQDEGAALFLGRFAGFDPKTLVDAFSGLAYDGPRRAAMSERGRALVDGKGADRLADDLIERLAA